MVESGFRRSDGQDTGRPAVDNYRYVERRLHLVRIGRVSDRAGNALVHVCFDISFTEQHREGLEHAAPHVGHKMLVHRLRKGDVENYPPRFLGKHVSHGRIRQQPAETAGNYIHDLVHVERIADTLPDLPKDRELVHPMLHLLLALHQPAADAAVLKPKNNQYDY